MIHPTAKIGFSCIIADSATIGENCVIKDFSFIGENVIIGDNCTIGRYCEIRDNVMIGDNNSFGSRCTISADAVIGNGNVIKYGFVLTDTPNLESKEKSVGTIANNVLIGANVCLMPGFSIDSGAIIGACSQVRSNVLENQIWYGNPAKYLKNR